MKLLLDRCVWGKAKDKLLAAGQDVIWAGDWAVIREMMSFYSKLINKAEF